MTGAPLLGLYRFGTQAFAPLGPALLQWRRSRGKEDPQRLGERLGWTRLRRPEGRLAWLHGASVGEGLALLPLVERLGERGLQVMVTTGTVTSASILAARLPARAFHQFVPLDVPRFVARFLDHWRPDVALIAESELWPNLLAAAKARKIPLALVNARLSPRSFRRWKKWPGTIGALLGSLDLCLAQTPDDAARLIELGAPRVQVAGNLKFDVPAPPVDAARLAEITGRIGSRPVWLAASTHPGEEEIACRVHAAIAAQIPGLLTVIAPRHAERGAAIASVAMGQNLPVARRSTGAPLERSTAIYVADTMGEMGLLYRLAPIVFVGKSLAGGGGQNPIEPAKLGSAILHGPDVGNFADIYRTLDDARGAVRVADETELARALTMLFGEAALLRRIARSAGETVDELGGAADHTMRALEPYFAQMRIEGR